MRRRRHHLFARRIPFALGLASGVAMLALPGVARATDLRLSLEEEFVVSDTSTLDKTTGVRTDSSAAGLTQTYRLDLQHYVMPNLVLRAGGLLERTNFSSALEDGSSVDLTGTRISPYADLTLRTPLYLASIGFTRREDKLEVSNIPTTTETRDTYTAAAAWFPDQLPSLDLRYERDEFYDADRALRDNTTQTFRALSEYQPIEPLNFYYQGKLSHTEDRVTGTTTDEVWNSIRGTYGDHFFHDRMDLYVSQEVNWRQNSTKTTSQGAKVTTLVTPIAGLSALDDTPLNGALTANPQLIDSNLNVAAGINLGLPPIMEFPVLPRNLGLDLLNATTEMSGLYVYVDPTVTLPTAVSASFRWDVYISSNNLDWVPVASALPGHFDSLLSRFALTFPMVHSRYLKVVVNPLGAAVPNAHDFPNILVTELQATATLTQTSGPNGHTTRTTQTQYLTTGALRIRLLEWPALDYYSTLFYSTTDKPNTYNLILTNGLRAFRRFNPMFSGSADVAREDTDNASTRTEAYRYSTSVTATPLSTLTSTLTYSGRNEKTTQKATTVTQNTDSQSVLLNTQAQLYRGIQAVVNTGTFYSTLASGEKTVDSRLDAGLDITPNDNLTINLYGTVEHTTASGLPTSTDRTIERSRIAVSYSPFTTLNLYMALDHVSGDTQAQTLQNYSLNWSPFRDGTLQFTFAYEEQLDSISNSINRYISPSVRWNIRRSTYLDVSYTMNTSTSDTTETKINTFRVTLNAVF